MPPYEKADSEVYKQAYREADRRDYREVVTVRQW